MSDEVKIIGNCEAIRRVCAQASIIARSDATVLIQGESGTGKGLVAEKIHRLSRRTGKRFCALNCAAVPEGLFESLLFGHVRGSFTGAMRDTEGQFEAADGGTLFLDELESLSLASQAKLLHVLETREILPLGAKVPRSVDVRIVAASNTDLIELVKEGQFRADLFYRVNVVPLRMPALRACREDILVLAAHFLGQYALETGSPVREFSDPQLRLLTGYSWPGNVRQLKNVVEHAVLMACDEPVIDMDTNPAFDFLRQQQTVCAEPGPISLNLRKRLMATEKQIVFEALRQSGGRRKRAAELLGIDGRNLGYYLRKHALERCA